MSSELYGGQDPIALHDQPTMRDWRGTEIKVGSIVVYPGRWGSSLWVNESEVLELRPGKKSDNYWERTQDALLVKRLRDTHAQWVEPRNVEILASRVTVVS